MDQAQEDAVASFCGVTGTNPQTAKVTLEQTNWNVADAVALFFAAQEGSDGEAEDTFAAPAQAQPSVPTASSSGPAAASSSSSRRPPTNNSRLRTLRDLQGGGSDDDDDDDDDKPRDLFAGGEKSGLAVQDPTNTGPADHFRNIMNQARQNAPRGGDSEDPDAGPSRPSAFRGPAQTLGGDDAPSRTIADPSARPAGPRSGRDLPKITRTLHLWADGVSIDDGPLFRFDDPANAQIMAQINRGHAPLSLLDVQPDQEVDLTLDPHKDENYVQPKQTYKPFGGSGNRLGSPVPGPSGTASSSTPATAPAPVAAATSSSTSAPTNAIDESTPSITLQIRLGDGTRLQSRFNTTQTIGDVYDFVSRAATTTRAYALMTTFPSKELDDKSVVLGDMSDFKRGGVVVQKWK